MNEEQINEIMKLVGRVVINCADLAEEKADVATLSASIAAVESALRSVPAISPQAPQAAQPDPIYRAANALIDAVRRDWPNSATHRRDVLKAADDLHGLVVAASQSQPVKPSACKGRNCDMMQRAAFIAADHEQPNTTDDRPQVRSI